jgi:lysophospholipase L1-like esterase
MLRNRLVHVSLMGAFLVTSLAHPVPPKTVRIACVGDSITWGSILKNRAQKSYPGQLARQLGTGFAVGNFGASGSFVVRNSPKPFLEHPFYDYSLSFRPNIVVLMVGTNDALPAVWKQNGTKFRHTLAQLVRSYQQLPERPKVFLALPPPLFAQKARGTNLEAHLRPEMIRLAKFMNLPVIDLGKPFRGKKQLFWDGIHPTEDACRMMADTIGKTIEQDARGELAKLSESGPPALGEVPSL